ncbi:MAG: TonB-dependent receptor [Gemmatimonadales bacterium]|nr:TonB-dependent receptor [Gemmatimonadales bacterium]
MSILGVSRIAAFVLVTSLASTPLVAQSMTAASVTGRVSDPAGSPVRGAAVTLERQGIAFRTATTDQAGRFTFELLPPGRYAILAEQVGYQPVRASSVDANAGMTTDLKIRMPQRPPPIDAVESINPQTTRRGGPPGRVVQGEELNQFDRFPDLTDVTRGLSIVDGARNAGRGFVSSANGLAPTFSRLLVDGIEERLLWHPGLPAASVASPVFPRSAIGQASVLDVTRDAELRGAQGAVLAAQSARGGGSTFFRPFARLGSSSLGPATIDNPADSSVTSARLGVVMGGSVKGDTISWLLRADYERAGQPTAAPFAALPLGEDPSGSATILRDAAGREITPWLAPVVRRRDGFTGGGQVAWSLGRTTMLTARAGMASWSEDNPDFGTSLSNVAGTRVDGRDFSAAMGLAASGEGWMNEARIGFNTASRDWTAGDVPSTILANDGIAIGAAVQAGRFAERAVELNDVVTLPLGSHRVKLGGSVQRRTHDFVFRDGVAARYAYGSAADFAAAQGFLSETLYGPSAAGIGITQYGGFLQDQWSVSPRLAITLGVHLDKEKLPADSTAPNARWGVLSGINTGNRPESDLLIAPRGTVSWDADGSGRTVIRLGAGLAAGRFDVSSLAEVAARDGTVLVRRSDGAQAWPAAGSSATTHPTLTFFGPDVRRPRTSSADLSLTQTLGARTTLIVSGGYRHADYLLRRDDLNLPAAPLSTASDGRAVYGSLRQYGGVIGAATGSNRRFDEFDAVFGLTSTGYADYYAGTIAVERRVTQGVSVLGSYTWSQARDNVTGQASANIEDRLSPLPDDPAWAEGISDFDVPHRLAATVSLDLPGKLPAEIAARGRYRSGLPFTPGYRAGVDINGDGAAGNDPAFLGASVPGMAELVAANACLSSQAGAIAARNSCREDPVHTLDLHASLGLDAGGRRIALVVDAFNVISSESGVVDRAALLIDPTRGTTVDGGGRLVLPVVANDGFGTLLSRRSDPRIVRLGIRMEF